MNSVVFVLGSVYQASIKSVHPSFLRVCVFICVCVKCVNKCVKVHLKVKIQGIDISCLQFKVRECMRVKSGSNVV